VSRDGKDFVDSTQLVRLLQRLESAPALRQPVIKHIGAQAYDSFKVGIESRVLSTALRQQVMIRHIGAQAYDSFKGTV
jgi:hypothetical protein